MTSYTNGYEGLRSFDAVVLGELLRSALAAKGAAVHWPADLVIANVAGFYK